MTPGNPRQDIKVVVLEGVHVISLKYVEKWRVYFCKRFWINTLESHQYHCIAGQTQILHRQSLASILIYGPKIILLQQHERSIMGNTDDESLIISTVMESLKRYVMLLPSGYVFYKETDIKVKISGRSTMQIQKQHRGLSVCQCICKQ